MRKTKFHLIGTFIQLLSYDKSAHWALEIWGIQLIPGVRAIFYQEGNEPNVLYVQYVSISLLLPDALPGRDDKKTSQDSIKRLW